MIYGKLIPLKTLFLTLFLGTFYLPFSQARSFSSAGEVFISFAKEKRGENSTKEMGVAWEKRITKSTIFWSVKETQDFLDYMENRVGTEHTLKSIKSPSYFSTMRYASFRERVNLYEEYIGSVETTHRLQRGLGGFHRGNVNRVKSFIEYNTWEGEKKPKKPYSR